MAAAAASSAPARQPSSKRPRAQAPADTPGKFAKTAEMSAKPGSLRAKTTENAGLSVIFRTGTTRWGAAKAATHAKAAWLV